jgi:hypothetical protein
LDPMLGLPDVAIESAGHHPLLTVKRPGVILKLGREPAPGGKAVGEIARHESPHVIARGIPASSRWCRLTGQRSEVRESFRTRRRGAEITREIKLIDLVDLVIVRKCQPCSRLYGTGDYEANKHGDDEELHESR